MTVEKLLLKISYATIPLFWPVWLMTLAVAFYFVASSVSTWRNTRPLTGLKLRTLVVVLFVLLPYLAFLFWGIDFAYHDNESFIDFTAAGQAWPISIWPYLGRYFPLQLQEFNVLGMLSPTPTFYWAFIAVELVAFCWLLDSALFDLPTAGRVVAIGVLVMSNSVGIVFAEPVYPERNIAVALATMIVALQRIEVSASRLNVGIALVAAHVALYCKEPVVFLLATVAISRLVATWRIRACRLRDRFKSRAFDVGLLLLSGVFLSQFLLSMLAFAGSRYVAGASVGSRAAAIYYLRYDPLLWGFLIALILRVASRRRTGFDPTWDSLALGALAYLLSLIAAGLAADRYMPPVDIIAILFGVRVLADCWRSRPALRGLLAPVASAIAVAGVLFGAFRLIEHKNVVRGTVKLGELVGTYAAHEHGEIHLYFPNAEGWRMMNFSAYLRYRQPRAFRHVRIFGPHKFERSLCVDYRTDHCEEAPTPAPGDLVIMLPNDAKRSDYPQARRLLDYRALPSIVPVALSRFLYPETPLGTNAEMPDGWLTSTALVIP